VLRGVSIEVPEHAFVGIVGESGSGKSTVAALIMGRYSATDGQITVGGTPSDALSEEGLMQAVTYVGFGSVFFKGTVRENLLLAEPAATDDKLWRALSDCALSEFLKSENGLDTLLQENAANLSGGQKQRLALARALLHDSPIYIFDEATSNIDVESEETILAQIRALAGHKTVVMISHRLANITDADCIYVMENGSIVETGTHAELLDHKGAYAALWETQSALERYGKEVEER
jgi:ATP-binding cassette subfamily C protein